MKRFLSLTGFVCLVTVSPVTSSAQTSADQPKATYKVAMNQDSFFGFYPTMSGAFNVKKNLDWTVYGIFWTTPSFGTGGGGGLWTEFGSGVNISTLDGKLTFTPQLGILNGKLLSNGNYPMAFEGIVPNITSNLNTSRAEGEFYMGRYTAIRTGRVPRGAGGTLVDASNRNNFLHWWINGGVKLSSVVSAGIHYESLGSNPSGNLPSASVYKWLGPYVQASLSKGFTVRFSAGPDVQDRPATDGTGSFYKLTATYTFQQ
jgi:hypothetical protein